MKQKQLSLTFGILVVTAIAVGVAILIWLRIFPPQASLSSEEPVGTPYVTPIFIVATEPTQITVEIEIPDPSYIAGNPVLQRLDANGRIVGVIGTLRDDATNGDRIAGDKFFTIQKTFTEATPGQILPQVSAFQGLLKRVVSESFVITVNPFHDPEQVINSIVADLRAGNVDKALQAMALSPKKAKLFKALSREQLNAEADAIAGRRLLRSEPDDRLYEMFLIDQNGMRRRLEFALSRDTFGAWYLNR